MGGEWGIIWHVWGQVMQLLLGNLYKHSITWWGIEDNIVLGQWCEWGHQPSDLGKPHVSFFFFKLLSNERCIHEELLFKWYVYWKGWLMKLDFIFCLCYPILLDNVFDHMICLINTDSIFTLDDINIEDIQFGPSWNL